MIGCTDPSGHRWEIQTAFTGEPIVVYCFRCKNKAPIMWWVIS